MYRFLKVLHLIGLTLFLGSVFGHIVASVGGGAPADTGFLAAREHIAAATRALTMPGLLLAIATGLAMVRIGGHSPRRQRWLAGHIAAAAIVFAMAAFVVVPAGGRLLSAAQALAAGDAADAASVARDKLLEDAGGAFNVAMTVLIVWLGTTKPRLGGGRRRPGKIVEDGIT